MPIVIDPNAYYTSAEYAELIGKTQKTVETERSRGTGAPFCKHGGRVLYAGKSIVAYLDANERQHGAAVKAGRADAATASNISAPAIMRATPREEIKRPKLRRRPCKAA
ncbi:MAG: hypothetical protein ACRYGP_21685 [Janthinobacterium lividum]